MLDYRPERRVRENLRRGLDLGRGHLLCAPAPVQSRELEDPVCRLVATTLAARLDVAPVEAIELFPYFLGAERAQLLRNRLPHELGLFEAFVDAPSTGVQVLGRVDGRPVEILGETRHGVAGNTESGRDSGCP